MEDKNTYRRCLNCGKWFLDYDFNVGFPDTCYCSECGEHSKSTQKTNISENKPIKEVK